MAYVTGPANSAADLLTAIQNACTANGWTLSGNVLHKGDCYTELLVVNANYLSIFGGTGIDGSDALTGFPVFNMGYKPIIGSPLTSGPFVWPITYAIHVFDHEVYCVLNWSVTNYTIAGFGSSPVAGLPGTGNWFSASSPNQARGGLGWASATDFYMGFFNISQNLNAVGLFWSQADSDGVSKQYCANFFHHGLDGDTDGWSAAAESSGAGPSTLVKAAGTAGPILLSQPNGWNGESILVPVQPYISRPSGMVSIVGDLEFARYINIANMEPGSIITLGSDQWKVYPFYKKGNPGTPTSQDSGSLGLALRYDGA